jgi:beta-aspartyl-peptidase (threonine type)
MIPTAPVSASNLVRLALVLLLGTALVLAADAPAKAAAADEKAAIRAVLDAQQAAWNKGDLETFMAGYWSSPDLTFFSGGDRKHGWKATLERYRERYQAKGAEMGKLTFSDLQIELLGPDAAFVRGRFTLERTKDRPTGQFTLILRRFPEGWRIIHDHTSG